MADGRSQMEVEGGNMAIAIVDQPPKTAESQFYEGTMFGLPREWTAEIRPRKASSKYFGKVDQFFYEPGTQRQFRSLKAVKRHLGLDVGQTSYKRKPKASKATSQSQTLHENDKFASKAARQSKTVEEKDKFRSSSKVDEKNDKSDKNYHYFDEIAKRIRWQFLNGDENCWETFVKVPDAVRKRWVDMFLKPDNDNQETNPPGMT